MRAARLAVEAGVSKGYLSELVNGAKAQPSIETCKKFAEVLGVSLGWLYDGELSPLLPAPLGHDAPDDIARENSTSYPFTAMLGNLDPKVLAGSSAEYLERIATALEKLVEIEDRKSRNI